MARIKEDPITETKKQKRQRGNPAGQNSFISRLHPETIKTIWALISIGAAAVITLAKFHSAGPAGEYIQKGLAALLGYGYFALPLSLLIVAAVFLFTDKHHFLIVAFSGAGTFLFSVLGLLHIYQPGWGGYLGWILGSLAIPFGKVAGIILNLVIGTVAVVATLNSPIKLRLPPLRISSLFSGASANGTNEELDIEDGDDLEQEEVAEAQDEKKMPDQQKIEDADIVVAESSDERRSGEKQKEATRIKYDNYALPPLSLLKSSIEKPTTGDLRANANIIKRTLESFGIAVEMGEVNVGPKFTRYTLKPAEGVKLTRILGLSQDLALALAAHPIRIEAPIPGKSLVGIEVPNKTAALVRLGNIMSYPEFSASGLLGVVLGRDVNGEPIFNRIDKMPHLLVAGATGSGKSILVHSLIISLLYKNSPDTLRLALIDPKRVELTMYDGLPHLIHPVITENKKAIGIFRWAIQEMERRYELLSAAGRRDIGSYNQKEKDDPLPYVVVVVDELADLMSTYGREIEGSIIRLAQMARATGIHLILATQRPSVEVITGLIKANITNRIALQVASQIDSRTILDGAGAEKLLGGGDLLFISPELSQPKRIQGSYISEDEISGVASFIRENNKVALGDGITGSHIQLPSIEKIGSADEVLDDSLEGDDDELYDEAVQIVREAKKASASFLQRRLKVGYARAARLLDLMEAHGVIGPGEGAKPREVFVDSDIPV